MTDQFASYCERMRQIYGSACPLMTRAQWDAACIEPRKARVLTKCEFDYSQFSEEQGDGPLY